MNKRSCLTILAILLLLFVGVWYLSDGTENKNTDVGCKKIYDSRNTDETFKIECPNGHWYWTSVIKISGQKDFVVPYVHADDCPAKEEK